MMVFCFEKSDMYVSFNYNKKRLFHPVKTNEPRYDFFNFPQNYMKSRKIWFGRGVCVGGGGG